MAMVINSNIMSLNAQNQLTKSQNELNTSMERLTSGKRINSAADDAAGLAIANRMTSQIRGLDQAVRNANDGQALIQTAEGALDETSNILQRMRELSIQSANGTYDSGNRSTLNAEVSQLQEELTRIADTTSFNGQNLLDGSLGELTLQVGADANQTISTEIGKLDAKSLGGSSADVIGTEGTGDLKAGLAAITGGADATTLKINGQNVGNLSDASAGTTLQDKLDTINSNISGVEVGAFTELEAQYSQDATGVIRGTDKLTIDLVGPGEENNTLEITETGSMEELVDKINEQGGGMLKASLNDEGGLVLASETGAQITVTASDASVAAGLTVDNATNVTQEAQLTFTITDPNVDNVDIEMGTTAAHAKAMGDAIGLQERDGSDITGFTGAGNAALADQELVINGVNIEAAETTGDTGQTQAAANVAAINAKSAETGVVASLNSDESITLNSVNGDEISVSYGDASNAETNVKALGFLETNTAESAGNSVADIDITTVAGAQKAIGILDDALEQVSSIRGDLGAVSNRLDSTMSNLSNISENQAAARSRIEDADFARESANLSRAQVLQQAGTSMLAQANSAPQQVLSLLQ